jgi:propanol-preferring alcohol dehydrogenase
MKAYAITRLCDVTKTGQPLELVEIPEPEPAGSEVLLKVRACGVCHTELDEIEGRTPPMALPMVPGHQVVGEVVSVGDKVKRFRGGERLGVGWIHSACGRCGWCERGLENLCPDFRATGRDAHGGYAPYMKVPEDFAVPIPGSMADEHAAPLLCAGAIGLRSLRLAGLENGRTLGLTGFGASAHLVLKAARSLYPDTDIYVFARSPHEREFALSLGAVWAGDTSERAPVGLDAVIDTTPVWKPVVEALANLSPAGRLVINAIRKEDADKTRLQAIDYPKHLWMEKEIKSVANVTRRDIADFLDLALRIPVVPEVEAYPWMEANRALVELRRGTIRGAKVLVFDR